MRVLVVEDERDLAAALQSGLEAEGFAVDAVANGVDGLWALQENEYDVVVLDLRLPGLSGYEVCRRARADGATAPILVLTAKDGEHDEADALDLGADDYLTKPFSFVVLLAHLRALLRRAPHSREPVLQAGDLRLDPAAHRCWRGDHEIALTSREFALTEFLLRRRGQVVTRGQLMDHVWPDSVDSDSNLVAVYIGYLRRKLDRPFRRHTIHTVRGVGYRLSDDPPPPSR